jgi:DNA-binding MarR family transcriptional regulator
MAATAPTVSRELSAFVEAFDAFVRASKRARARAPIDDEALTASQYDLVAPLAEAGDGTLGLRELARAAGVAAPTATRMVDGLERRGLVSRVRSADDRRAVQLSLTAAGSAAVELYRAGLLERRRKLFAALEPQEQRAAAQMLSRLAAAYEEVR